MRHRKKGRILGRNPTHLRAMLKNLASSLFLTELEDEDQAGAPKVPGRVITTLEKAKEVRPRVEKCITIARKALPHLAEAEKFGTTAERGSSEWRTWRKSPKWRQWAEAMSPVVAARRRTLVLLGNKQAVRVLFSTVAPRYADRNGGYTRILRLAKPRLGDAGTRAIIEFVGVRDRAAQKSKAPKFSEEPASK